MIREVQTNIIERVACQTSCYTMTCRENGDFERMPRLDAPRECGASIVSRVGGGGVVTQCERPDYLDSSAHANPVLHCIPECELPKYSPTSPVTYPTHALTLHHRPAANSRTYQHDITI